jgi:hypothetical protein
MKLLSKSALALTSIVLVAGATPSLAATEADFKAAFEAAQAANAQAGTLRDQWTVTANALKEAKKAADAGDYDKALAEAKQAEALAKASVFQATSEKEAWKAEVIR